MTIRGEYFPEEFDVLLTAVVAVVHLTCELDPLHLALIYKYVIHIVRLGSLFWHPQLDVEIVTVGSVVEDEEYHRPANVPYEHRQIAKRPACHGHHLIGQRVMAVVLCQFGVP